MKSIVLYTHIRKLKTSQLLLLQHGVEPTLKLRGKTLNRKLLRERFVQGSWLGLHVWGCAGDVGCARRIPSLHSPPALLSAVGNSRDSVTADESWKLLQHYWGHQKGEMMLPVLPHSSSSGLTDFSVPVVVCIHNTPALHLQQLNGLCTLGLEVGVVWSHCLSFVSKLKQEGN